MPEVNEKEIKPEVKEAVEERIAKEKDRNIRIAKLNTKKLLTYALLSLIPVVVLVMTWIPFFFDFLNISWQKWLTSSLVNIGISVASIIVGEMTGYDKQTEKVGGLYQNALTRFNSSLKALRNSELYQYFSQFFTWFKARELKQLKEDYLVDNGIDLLQAHYIITYAEIDDIEKMRQGSFKKLDEKSGKEIRFRKVTEEQYLIIKNVYNPNFQLETYKCTYYLSASGDGTAKSILSRAVILNEKEANNKNFRRWFKIALYVFISILWAAVAIQELTSEGAKEAALNSMIRLFTFVSGVLSGFMTAVVSVKLEAEMLDDKSDLHDVYRKSYKVDFFPKTYEEIVDEAIEQEAKEKEEELKNIITPEVVQLEEKEPLMIESDELKNIQEETDSKGE
jgi:hypothetical protein